MKIGTTLAGGALTLLAAVAACSHSETQPAGDDPSPAGGSQYVLADEPAGAQDVIQVRAAAKDQDEVTVVGRIGGSVDPWVKGMAAFTIVDPSKRACSDIPGDECETPWDYCCETLTGATALVKFVDEDGRVVKTDARELLKLKELQTVVVRGKAQRGAEGNLVILATGLHVRK